MALNIAEDSKKPGFKSLFETIYGTNPQNYGGTFQEAYKNLYQPEKGHEDVIANGTFALANAYADEIYAKTGKLPTEGELRDFVGTALTPDFAKRFVTGLGTGDIVTNYVNPYLENKKFTDQTTAMQTPEGQQKELANTISQLNAFYDPLQAQAILDTNRGFNDLFARGAESEAHLGRLRSGVSADPSSVLQQNEAQRGNALSNVISGILGAKASGALDYSKFNQGQQLSREGLRQAQNQFMQTLGFNKQSYSDQMANEREKNMIAREIGRLQGQGKQRDAFDWIGLGVQGAGTAASLAALA